MRFLPVVERELRVAARSKATQRSRFIAALLGAFVLAAMTMTMQRSAIPSRIGSTVFDMIVFLLTWFCLIGGVMTRLAVGRASESQHFAEPSDQGRGGPRMLPKRYTRSSPSEAYRTSQ